MDAAAQQFREAAARHNRGRSKPGWRYPEQLRRLAAEYCRRRRQAGDSFVGVAEELGVSTLTLGRWLDEELPARFHPVEIVESRPVDEPAGVLAVVTPGGLRIEGLDWPQALELARLFR